ncbi:conserved hypothetical protein [Ricinus communis]|uniref:Uncharacterized protein n=1 Tax=Ricinus communis TaxID=3988 RepID=B9RB92_RICCO|nr:conserved hypothetical protein [Ricinus communis]
MALDKESQEQCIEKARNSIWQCHEDPKQATTITLDIASDAKTRGVINVCKKSMPEACYPAASSSESHSDPSMTHSK